MSETEEVIGDGIRCLAVIDPYPGSTGCAKRREVGRARLVDDDQWQLALDDHRQQRVVVGEGGGDDAVDDRLVDGPVPSALVGRSRQEEQATTGGLGPQTETAE